MSFDVNNPITERVSSKRAFVAANGCPENRIDAATHGEFLRANGWEPISTPEEADLILFSACGLTKGCEYDSLKRIAALKQAMRPGARLIVAGCLTKINPGCLAGLTEEPLIPPGRSEALAPLIGGSADVEYSKPWVPLSPCSLDNRPGTKSHCLSLARLRKVTLGKLADRMLEYLYSTRRSRLSEFSDTPPGAYSIKIGSGCLGKCSYCAIKLSRGRIVSKPPAEVLASFRNGLAQGYKEFVLLGNDQGSYGADLGTDVSALLTEMVAEPGDYKIRIRNLEPAGLISQFSRLRPIFASGRINLVASPVQSGSEAVLQRMRRHYSIADFKSCVKAMRRDYPEIRLRTQVLLGFPGETEEDFRATLKLLDELYFDLVEVYIFSPRPGTEAERMTNPVPESVQYARRCRVLAKLFRQSLGSREKAIAAMAEADR